jgi:DMSO/TMAO reductase YedYZ molybdopterin-dependent catalytic subunit
LESRELPGRSRQVGPQEPSSLESWTLEVAGLVNSPRTLTVAGVSRLGAPLHADGGVNCPEGFATTRGDWSGVSLLAVMEAVQPRLDARYVSIHSGDFVAAFRLESIDRRGAVLATALDGRPIPWSVGGPIRLVPSSGACFDTVKWVQRISFDPDGSAATALEIVRARRGNET